MDEMLEGETYGEYTERFKDRGYSIKELHEKATAAWFARREVKRNPKSALSNELVITVTIEDFTEDFKEVASPAKIKESVVLDISKMPDHGPEVKFEMIEYVIERIMETIKKELVPNGPTEILSDHI